MTAVRVLVIVAAAAGDAPAAPAASPAASPVASPVASIDQPVARYAPKGRPPQHGAPSVLPSLDATQYSYVAFRQSVGVHGAGAGAMVTQADPAIGVGDFHSLAEIAVESTGNQQIVELGWTIDPQVNGDLQPHVFAFHWVDGQATCYNACGWVQVSPDKRPGMRVVPGESHRYEIRLVNGDWWLFYDREAMGYYPQQLWSGRFTQVALTQWFGEVAAASATPCTEMGNGKLGADSAATAFSDLHVFDAAGPDVPAMAEMGALTRPDFYNLGRTTPTSFGFGGPGALAGCCTPATCHAVQADCGQLVDPVCAGNMLACGVCDGADVCTSDHKCPAGIGPRDGGQAFDAPIAGSGGGCCDAGARDTGCLVTGALVALVLGRRRRHRAGPRFGGSSAPHRCTVSSRILGWVLGARCSSWVIGTGRSASRRRRRAR